MNDMRHAWQTFALAAATIFMVSLDATVVVAAFPALRAAFVDSNAATLSWVINGYTIVFAALLVPFGRIVDQVGHRFCFWLSTAGFTLASAACGLASSPEWLIAARVVQAIAAAMISPASLALILAAFPVEQRGRSAGLWSAVGALAAASGPVIGSLLIEWISWRMIFLINLPIGLAVLFWSHLQVTQDRPTGAKKGFDLVGSMLIMGGVGGIAGGLSQAGESASSSIHVMLPIVLGVVLMVGLLLWARQRENSALDLLLFADRHYRWASLAMLLLGIAFGLMFLSFYLLFTGLWHYPQSAAGLAATPGPFVATLVAAGLSHRFLKSGVHRPMMIGGLVFAASNGWLALNLNAEPAYFAVWLPGQVLGGIAIGLMLPGIAAAAVAHLPPHLLGTGSAVSSALRQLGSALGVALAVALVGTDWVTINAFREVYVCLVVCGVFIAAIAWKMRVVSEPKTAMTATCDDVTPS
jgi:EmrB/QacA subfamily drug resistance transporter